MHVKPITKIEDWENFLLSQTFTPFVQSPRYIDFYKSLNEDGFLIGLFDANTLVGGSVVVTTHAKRGDFLYLPYGPILPAEKSKEALELLMDFLKNYAQKNNFIFIRVSPFLDDTIANQNLFLQSGFRFAPMHVLAENTWILDLFSSEQTILKNMNKNHRNLIRRCEREGVVIKKTTDVSRLDSLGSLLDITAERHKFKRFSQDYIVKEFTSFLSNNVMLFESYLPNDTLDSVAVIMFYGKMAVYRHSASRGENSKLPTSYLLQWEAIKEAKHRGKQWYNFWGIAPEEANQQHPFVGITHFKKGFGGFKKDLLHCLDYPVKQKYWLNWIVETGRRIHRGF